MTEPSNNVNHDISSALSGADILVVDDTSENLRLVTELLKKAGYKPRAVPNGELALQAVAKRLPDLILLDIRMPGMDGFQVCSALRERPESRDIPIIFLSALSDAADKLKAFEAGGVDYITKPFQVPEVLARVKTCLELAHNRAALARARNILEQLAQERSTEVASARVRAFEQTFIETSADILIVDNEPENLRLMTGLLIEAGYKARGALNGKLALQAVEKQPPDLILLDVLMPNMDGFQVCEALRQQSKTPDIPIIFLTVLNDITAKVRAFEVGGMDYITKPINALELLARVNTHIRLWRMQQGLERLVAERTAELATSEERFRRIFESMEEGYLLTELSGRILAINPATVKMLKYVDSKDLVNKDIESLLYVEPSDRQKLKEHLKQYGRMAGFVTQFKQSDNTVICIECNTHWVHDASGIPIAIESTFRDITERKQAELALLRHGQYLEEMVEQRTAELVQARNVAEAANRAKSAFLANMSHELRTPLNTILGFSELLHNSPHLSPEEQESLSIICKSGDHLLELINDVLEIAKIEAGHIVSESEPFDFGTMVLDIVAMLRIRAQSKNIQLLLEQAPDVPRYLVGDEAKLRQIIINLLSNAIKATDEGCVTLRLAIKANKVSHLIIEVEDTGYGIAPEDQAHLFDPFVQVGSHRSKKQGTGLGLAITKQFVELMNGHLGLSSTLGQGSTFRAEVVVQVVQEEELNQSSKSLGRVIGIEADHTYRVLVVDDQVENCLLLVKLLESVGFEVRAAENGKEAIACFQQWQPHFIWMDRRMPIMDGVEATQQIRALSGGDKVHIAAVTASSFKEEDAELIKAGFEAIVHKPYRANQIFNCMEHLLAIRFLRAEPENYEVPASDISNQDLWTLPEPLCEELEQAVMRLDSELVLEIIQSIAEVNSELASALKQKANSYNYAAILNALTKLKENKT